MQFTDEEIDIKPGHVTRNWQSCDYYAQGQHLFHERASLRSRPPGQRAPLTPAQVLWIAGGDLTTKQWFGGQGTRAEIEALAAKHGGHAMEEFYPAEDATPLYFLAFGDTDKALAFCRTADFDALCLTLEKV
jgi:hypothetical protein